MCSATATTVEVGVNCNANQVEVTVKDNGYGFDLAAYRDSPKAQNHHGLVIMKERAESLRGKLAMNTAPGMGTEVKVAIPLE